MEIDNNKNISNMIASSISKLNLNSANNSFVSNKPKQRKENQNLIQENKKDDVKIIDDDKIAKKPIDVKDVQKYASLIGEEISEDEIKYGLMYGRSVIADFIA